MPSLVLAVLSFVATLASAGAGVALGRALPQAHLSGRGRDLIGGTAALIGVLLAATLALSLAQAQGVAQAQKTALQRLAAQALAFNLAMKSFGPDAAEARRMLGGELAQVDSAIRDKPVAPDAVAADIGAMNARLAGLTPATDAQRQALAAAERLYGEIAEARLVMALPLADPVSSALVLTLICWSCLVFGGLGLLSPAHPAALAALTLGGAAVASALFLILDLSQPLSGALRLSPAPIERILMEIAP